MPDGKVEKQLKDCETKIVALEKRVAALEGQMHTKVDEKRVSQVLLPSALLRHMTKAEAEVDQRQILEKSKVEAGKAAMEAAEAFLRKADFKRVAAEAAEAAAQRAIVKANFQKIAFEAASAAAKKAGSAPPLPPRPKK